MTVAPPDLKNPQARAEYRRELIRLHRGWRWLGLLIVSAGVVWALTGRHGWDATAIALEAIGWTILLAIIVLRSRYHRRRTRG
jgi:drug/metabolite transporter (DMT)-like permease